MTLQLSGLDKMFTWVQADELKEQLIAVFGDWSSTTMEFEPTVEDSDFLFHGLMASRQEERMVLMMLAMINDPSTAYEIARRYQARTRSRRESRHSEEELAARRGATSALQSRRWCKSALIRVYQEVYPRHRGQYLLSLSRHLGHIKEIAHFVRERGSQSRAADIVSHRAAIVGFLKISEL
ncbi:MAG: hypothetical protein IPL62_02950 [Caulobacteraceae bacterium]|nr:hypothetical protein [Caulobacteraceae bacterium]